MSLPVLAPQVGESRGLLADRLPGQTYMWAKEMSTRVAKHYLAFRRIYYHEPDPSLDAMPPAHAEIHQAEIARLADNTLRLMPAALKSVPLLGGLLAHLQQVANIHSISERERAALHNLTMAYLHGVRGGIQPWYVSWLLASVRNLSAEQTDQYYMQFPWDALLYLDAAQLQAFEEAVAHGDIAGIEGVLERLADRLVRALDDPIGVQPELAFTGPDSERRRLVFRLKTSAALALGAYLVVEEARVLLHPHEAVPDLRSALAPLPPELMAQMTPSDQRQA